MFTCNRPPPPHYYIIHTTLCRQGRQNFFIVILNVKLTFLHLIILQGINYSDRNYIHTRQGCEPELRPVQGEPPSLHTPGGRSRTQINKMTNSETNLNLLRPILEVISYTNSAGDGNITSDISHFPLSSLWRTFIVLLCVNISGGGWSRELVSNTQHCKAVGSVLSRVTWCVAVLKGICLCHGAYTLIAAGERDLLETEIRWKIFFFIRLDKQVQEELYVDPVIPTHYISYQLCKFSAQYEHILFKLGVIVTILYWNNSDCDKWIVPWHILQNIYNICTQIYTKL